MKKFIRITAILLCIIMTVILLGGCGEKTETGSSEPSSTSSEKTETSDVSSASSEITSSEDQPISSETSDTSSGTESSSKSSSQSSGASSQGTSSSSGSSDSKISYITKGLVARYDFEDKNNIGKDASGNGNNLYVWGLNGKTVGQTNNSLNSALGKAAQFNGGALLAAKTLADSKQPSNDFLDSINSSYSICFFARNTLTTTTPDEVHKTLVCNGYWNDLTTPNLEYAFTYKNDNGYNSFASYINYGAMMNDLCFRKFEWQVDNGSFYRYGVVDTDWYHYVIVVNKEKSTVDLYIDGKLVKSNSPGQKLATQSKDVPFSVGGMAVPMEDVPVRDLLVGEMDDLRIYSRALSVYEIGNIQRLKG